MIKFWRQILGFIVLLGLCSLGVILFTSIGKYIQNNINFGFIGTCPPSAGCVFEIKNKDSIWLKDISISPGANLMALSSYTKPIQLWDLTSNPPVKKFELDKGDNIAFSSDGRQLAALAQGIKIWDTSTGQVIGNIDPGGSSQGIRFSADDRILAGISGDLTMIRWDLKSGQKLSRQPLEDCQAVSTVSSSTNDILAVACNPNTVQFWQISTGSFLGTLPVKAQLPANEKAYTTMTINKIIFSPDNSTLALVGSIAGSLGGGGPFIQVWDMGQQRLIYQFGSYFTYVFGFEGPANAISLVTLEQTVKDNTIYSDELKLVHRGVQNPAAVTETPVISKLAKVHAIYGKISLPASGQVFVTGDDDGIRFWNVSK